MIVSWPRWGWSGKPAPGEMVKWSSIRKGEKLRSLGMPIERRTRAPAPSDCSTARKAWRMALGTLMLAGLEDAKNVGGMRGRSKKEVVGLGAGEFKVLCDAGKRFVNWIWCSKLVS